MYKKLALVTVVAVLLFLAYVWTTSFGFSFPQSTDIGLLLKKDAWFLAAIGLIATAISLISLFIQFKLASPIAFVGWVFYLPVIFNVLVPMFVFFFSILGIFYTPWLVFTEVPLMNRLINGVIRLPDETLSNMIQYSGYALTALGLVVYIVGLFQVLSKAARKKAGLVTNGLYAVVKHPQYLGIFMWTLGFAVAGWRVVNYLMWLTLCFSYMLLAEYEEARLAKELGQEYFQYKGNVSFIIPYSSRLLKPLGNFGNRLLVRILVYTALYIVLLFVTYYTTEPYVVVYR